MRSLHARCRIRSLHAGCGMPVRRLPRRRVVGTKFVGRISLSAESLHNQFIIGGYGNLPYIGVCNRKNFLSKLLEKHASSSISSRISLSAESLHNQFIIGRYGNLPYEVCRDSSGQASVLKHSSFGCQIPHLLFGVPGSRNLSQTCLRFLRCT